MVRSLVMVFCLQILAWPVLASELTRLETPTGTLYGTLEIPKGKGPFPVALIIAGSGPTDRDGNTPLAGRNDSLKLLAMGLAKHGIATLRTDKRGIGASVQALAREADLRFEDYVNDAMLWLVKLSRDPRFRGLTVIGHSEGSLIGMLVAARGVEGRAVDMISLAGAGRNIGDVLLEQLERQFVSAPRLFEESRRILLELRAGRTVANMSQDLAVLFRLSVQPYLISLLRYDPAQELAKLVARGSRVLVVQGTTDLQVTRADAVRLAEGAQMSPVFIEEMNHVLKQASLDPNEQQRTYNDPAQPLAVGLVSTLAEFILQGNSEAR